MLPRGTPRAGAARRASTRALPPLALAPLFFAACGDAPSPAADEPPAEPLSVLLVTLDTVRADALSCYATEGAHSGSFAAPAGATPNLDALAARGVRYTRATTVAPLTLPAHASMLTGWTPPAHGIRENGLWGLAPEIETLPERAAAAGIDTAAFVAAVVLDRGFGLEQGFGVYDQPERPEQQTSSHFSDRPANVVVERALAWLQERPTARRFFLWVHLFDAHNPYEPPPAYAGDGSNDALYQGEVRFVDAQVGRLVRALEESGRADETLILVVADHGESLGEHGELSHAAYCYEATMRVPFLVVYPNAYRAGTRSGEVVSVVDVAPTALEALGLASGEGRSEAAGQLTWRDGSSLYGRTLPDERAVYFESFSGNLSFGWSPLVGVRTRTDKFIHSSAPELFEPERDPNEAQNLAASAPERAQERRQWLGRFLAAARDEGVQARAAGGGELASAIAQLGYAAAAGGAGILPEPLAASTLPAPHERAQEYEETLRASALQNAGRSEEAQQLAARLVRGNAGNVVALQTWTGALLSLERYGEAVAPLQRLLGLRPDEAGFHYNLGVALSHSGREDAAIASLWHAVELDPTRKAYMDELMQLLRRLDRREDFEAYKGRWQALQEARAR